MENIPDCELKNKFDERTPEVYGPKFWMVRNCEWYWEEYKECSRFLGRVHQYFIFGRNIDCSDWLNDYNRCKIFRKTNDKSVFDELVESEEQRIKQRLDQSRANDVWKYRSEPPKDWNKPLPPSDQTHPSPFLMYEQKKRNQERI